MNLLKLISLLASILTIASAAPFIAFSTHDHFSCTGQFSPSGICDHPQTSTISQSSIPHLLRHLTDPSTSNPASLPLHLSASLPVPELILIVYAHTIRSDSPQALLHRVAQSLSPQSRAPSSFYADTDRDARLEDILSLPARMLSLQDLVATDHSLFDNALPDIVTVSIADEQEQSFFDALSNISMRTKNRFALLLTTRQGDANAPAADAEPAPAAEAAPAADSPLLVKTTNMNPPEISDAIVAGLIVLLFFLIIFIPGFMCLWNIQPPQAFEMFDANDAKKKMQ